MTSIPFMSGRNAKLNSVPGIPRREVCAYLERAVSPRNTTKATLKSWGHVQEASKTRAWPILSMVERQGYLDIPRIAQADTRPCSLFK